MLFKGCLFIVDFEHYYCIALKSLHRLKLPSRVSEFLITRLSIVALTLNIIKLKNFVSLVDENLYVICISFIESQMENFFADYWPFCFYICELPIYMN